MFFGIKEKIACVVLLIRLGSVKKDKLIMTRKQGVDFFEFELVPGVRSHIFRVS